MYAAQCHTPNHSACLTPPFDLQEHGGDASAGYAEMGSKGGSEGGSKGGQARKEQLAEVNSLHADVPECWQNRITCA